MLPNKKPKTRELENYDVRLLNHLIGQVVTVENIETDGKMAQTIGPKIPCKRRGRVNWKLSQIIGVIEKSVATRGR